MCYNIREATCLPPNVAHKQIIAADVYILKVDIFKEIMS